MNLILIVLHVVVSVALILIVLLQTGKGSDVGAAFGGGASQTVFGSQGTSSFLSKLTAAAAIIFMLTSLGLSLFVTNRPTGSVMEGFTAPINHEAPQNPPASGSPAEPPSRDRK